MSDEPWNVFGGAVVDVSTVIDELGNAIDGSKLAGYIPVEETLRSRTRMHLEGDTDFVS